MSATIGVRRTGLLLALLAVGGVLLYALTKRRSGGSPADE